MSKKRKNPYWEDEFNILLGKIKRRKLRSDEYYDFEGNVRREKKPWWLR